MQDKKDTCYIRRCIELAAKAAGHTSPNPMVGALIVCNGQVISEGYHRACGEPHAEAVVINAVKDKELLKDSTLYVNLEPCCHQGRTPPCSELIIKSGIKSVIIGAADNNPEVAGRGIESLKEHNINVICGVLEEECKYFNRRFYLFNSLKRPYIILKWAETADGFIAREDYSSKWISSQQSRKLVHHWRLQESAVMVGTNTAFYDNPELTVRHIPAVRQPLRIVLDRTLRLNDQLKLLNDPYETIIVNEQLEKISGSKQYTKIKFDENLLENLLGDLYRRKILSLLVEGGSRLLNTFISKNLWDEARIFKAPKTFESGLDAPLINEQPVVIKDIAGDSLKLIFNPLSTREFLPERHAPDDTLIF
ncbi:MAG: bifunctional diaminohydroxyphosphoribosylaminopyrimidine deaminase/5-amino-6-(5-phosphoribosylamino)uracil reductase RibD [Candidatus Dadabacteria bacterium]|nr:MAG: bifunctional diaminohydroxyphosphoribosylaminopyrimidine deaminase/5-amino-6-(5-phosphoribosylamino)uracil reductase RibD [Candidatus Dadabacteria bacterium]